MKKISMIMICALFMAASLMLSSCNVFGVTKVSVATTTLATTTNLPTTEPEQEYKSASFDFTVQYTMNWINYSDAASGQKASMSIDMPKEWTLDSTVYSLNDRKMAEIFPITLLKEDQGILDYYAYTYTGEMAQVLSKKTVTLKNYTARMIEQLGGEVDGKKYYINTYYVQGDDLVGMVSFYSYEKRADEKSIQIYEHCVDSIQLIKHQLPTNTQSSTAITSANP